MLTREWWHTPRLVLGLAGVVIATLLGVAAVAGTVLSGGKSGLDSIGHQTAPQAVRSADLYFALNDMDAQAANLLLAGADPDFAKTRSESQSTYENRRKQADEDLQAAAEAASTPADQQNVHTVLDQLGAYEALVARAELQEDQTNAPAGKPAQAGLETYRQATDLLSSQLLPAAKKVIDANDGAVVASYSSQRGDLGAGVWWLALTGLLALAALVVLQWTLSTRFRRRINPPLAAATLLAAVALLGAIGLVRDTSSHLDTAKRSAYDSVIALSKARAQAYDMNADESRYLIDPSRASQYEQTYRQKAGLTDKGIADEQHNITFAGEGDAAQRARATFNQYQDDDRKLRDLAMAGQLKAAITFDTGTAPGQSNADFDLLSGAISDTMKINQTAFDSELKAADSSLGAGTAVAGGIGLLVAVVLVLLGIRPRLREYR